MSIQSMVNTQKSADGCIIKQKSFQFLKFRWYCDKNQEHLWKMFTTFSHKYQTIINNAYLKGANSSTHNRGFPGFTPASNPFTPFTFTFRRYTLSRQVMYKVSKLGPAKHKFETCPLVSGTGKIAFTLPN
jgi:hypothetical protein